MAPPGCSEEGEIDFDCELEGAVAIFNPVVSVFPHDSCRWFAPCDSPQPLGAEAS
jgi:hypothetical protein